MKRPAFERARVAELLGVVHAIPFDERAARVFGKVGAHLADAGTPTGSINLAIAATAVSRGIGIVTHNRKHFDRVPGLRVEDWQAEET